MHDKTALELQQMLKNGQTSATEITKYFLDRIDRYNEKLGAFLTVFHEKALRKAKEIDEKRALKKPVGKLAGIPVAIKDNMHIKGEKTTCASNFLTEYTALFNATVVERLAEEDAIFIGKTNLDEFAMGSSSEHSFFFPVKNPWDETCTPGGSSGGSSAAVSARLCPIALGSDTGGSIRQPAAFTGIVGFKPTYGRISRYGLVAFGSSFDQIGPMTSTVADTALSMEILGGKCSHDATSLQDPNPNYLDELELSLHGKKVGIDPRLLDQLSSESKKHFENSVDVLKQMGIEIVEVDLSIIDYSVAMYYILATAEASTNLARFDGVGFSKRSEKAQTLDELYELSKHDGFGPEVKRRILLGTFVISSGYQDAYYTQAQKVRTLMIQQFERAFTSCDAIVMPTTGSSAFKLKSIQDPLQMYLQDVFTISANLTGMPSISVPCGFDSNDMPLGIQFIGPQKEDARVLRFGYQFEKAMDLGIRTPKNFSE